MHWTKTGENYSRVYTASGKRGSYQVDLDMPADRWAIYLNRQRLVENVYYIDDAKYIVEEFDVTGNAMFPKKLRVRPDNGVPGFVSGAQPIPLATPIPKSPITPMSAEAAAAILVAGLSKHRIEPDQTSLHWSPWQSGVYSLLDCVFSAQAKYETTVLPMLARVQKRPGMADHAALTFSDFLHDVDAFGPNKFERCAAEVLTRQRVGGRLKVAVAYDAAQFLITHRLETMSDLQNLGDRLAPFITSDLQTHVVGIGPALAHYLVTLLGDENHIKLDVHLLRFWNRFGLPTLNPSAPRDYAHALHTYRHAAALLNTTPARLDKAIWTYESSKSSAGVIA